VYLLANALVREMEFSSAFIFAGDKIPLLLLLPNIVIILMVILLLPKSLLQLREFSRLCHLLIKMVKVLERLSPQFYTRSFFWNRLQKEIEIAKMKTL